jgi:streptomycin 6-kinase
VTRANITVDVPAIVRAKAVAASGNEDWLHALPCLVTDLERAWSMTLTTVLPGGSASFVARAVTDDGRHTVVKVAVPGSGLAQQVRTLTAADGDGYVTVLDHAPEHDAVLLEALGPSLHEAGLTPTRQLSVLARLLRRAWRVPPATAATGTGAEPQNKAAGLAELITGLWRELDNPCEEAVIEQALTCAERRSAAFDPTACVVVHGDAATANAARVLHPRPGTEDGFVLLDPDGFLGDPTYDLGVALRDWCPQLSATQTPAALLSSYCEVLAREAAVDPATVWEWGYLERVSTGLYALSLGGDEHALPYLRTAEALLVDGAFPRGV